MSLLSIVIPVYNVENYIEECMQSILSQPFDNYEVILVDNGSTDKSGEICDAYASSHNQIRVIHLLVNSLPAGARNAGINAAKGQYIHFCDSDDYYIQDCFPSIASTLNQYAPDILVGQFICKPEEGAYVCSDVKLNPEIFKSNDHNVIAEYFYNLPKLLCTPWRFIVKRDFLVDNDLRFLEGYHAEDEEWFPKVLCCSEKTVLLSEPFYCYRPRATGSVTSTKQYINSKSQLMAALSLLRFLRMKCYKDYRRELIFSRVGFLLSLFSSRCDTFSTEQLNELAGLIEYNPDSLDMLGKMPQPYELYHLIASNGAYAGLCLYRENVINKTLEKVRGKETADIYIFPTGYNGEGTARVLKNAGYNVKGFLDNSQTKNGCSIDGLPVTLPVILKKLPPYKLENTFVIVTIQQEHIAVILMEQLRELGLDDSQFTTRTY